MCFFMLKFFLKEPGLVFPPKCFSASLGLEIILVFCYLNKKLVLVFTTSDTNTQNDALSTFCVLFGSGRMSFLLDY